MTQRLRKGERKPLPHPAASRAELLDAVYEYREAYERFERARNVLRGMDRDLILFAAHEADITLRQLAIAVGSKNPSWLAGIVSRWNKVSDPLIHKVCVFLHDALLKKVYRNGQSI